MNVKIYTVEIQIKHRLLTLYLRLLGGSYEIVTSYLLHLCMVTSDPFYNMHLVPVKPKAPPASYLLNVGAKG